MKHEIVDITDTEPDYMYEYSGHTRWARCRRCGTVEDCCCSYFETEDCPSAQIDLFALDDFR